MSVNNNLTACLLSLRATIEKGCKGWKMKKWTQENKESENRMH